MAFARSRKLLDLWLLKEVSISLCWSLLKQSVFRSLFLCFVYNPVCALMRIFNYPELRRGWILRMHGFRKKTCFDYDHMGWKRRPMTLIWSCVTRAVLPEERLVSDPHWLVE
jgi:hypothetical protein